MGGNAFPTPARRMSSPTHALLLAHAHSALVPAFFPRAEALRDVRSKKDHGDLDLIAGWDDKRAWKLKGEERGEVDGGLNLGGGMVLRDEADCTYRDEGKGEGEEAGNEGEEGMVRWAFKMARALKAGEWVRRGSEISFAIPCRVVDPAGPEEGFYQLDVPFVPLAALDFYLLSVSYSSTFLILARAVRCISPSFTLQMVGLIIRHAAYPGIPGIDVLLTPSATSLCSYLGLSQERWSKGFGSEKEVWEWLADVKEGGMLEVAYKKMVKPRAVRQKGHKKKMGALDGFVAFLRGTKWGEGWDADMDMPAPESRVSAMILGGDGGDEKRPETPLDQIRSIPTLAGLASLADTSLPPLSPSGTATSIASSGPLTPSTSMTNGQDQPEATHPDSPTPLDPRALAALHLWGKQDEYDAELKERKGKAAYLYERQMERVKRRERARGMEFRKMGLQEEGQGEESLKARLRAVQI